MSPHPLSTSSARVARIQACPLCSLAKGPQKGQLHLGAIYPRDAGRKAGPWCQPLNHSGCLQLGDLLHWKLRMVHPEQDFDGGPTLPGPRLTVVPQVHSQAAEAGGHVTGHGDPVLTGRLNPGDLPPFHGKRQPEVWTAIPWHGGVVQPVGLWTGGSGQEG